MKRKAQSVSQLLFLSFTDDTAHYPVAPRIRLIEGKIGIGKDLKERNWSSSHSRLYKCLPKRNRRDTFEFVNFSVI